MRAPVFVIGLAMFVVACSGSDTGPASGASGDIPAAPLFAPGVTTTGVVEIDGVAIDYVMVAPNGFAVGDRAPVLLAFPPGVQDLDGVQNTVARLYQAEALRRGWVVVSPAAPGGTLYYDGSEDLIPGVIAWINSWVDVQGDGVHLAGVSNGGISAFRVAAQNADQIKSIVVFPGLARSGDDQRALDDMADVRVTMFVGQNDTSWLSGVEETRSRLEDAGAEVTLEIVPGSGHIIEDLWDGKRIFEELDAARFG